MLNTHYLSSAAIYREWIIAEKAKAGKVDNDKCVMITRYGITKIATIDEITAWIISPWDFWNDLND